MKRFLVAAIVALFSAGILAPTSYADGPRRYYDDRSYSQRGHKHHHKHKHAHRHKHKDQHHYAKRKRKVGPPPHVLGYRAVPPHAVRHHPRWKRGDRLPHVYLAPHYVVHDWNARKFRRPPPGHRWVRVGTDYFLVGVATGVILHAVFSQ